jgi:hypothetical protein
MNKCTIIVAGLVVPYLWSCSSPPKSLVTQTKPGLSATKEVRLRVECAKQGDQVEKDNPHADVDDVISWSTDYSVKDNRCYVLQSSYNGRLGLQLSFLYDGQTKENLASTEQGNGEMNGTIEGAPDMDCSEGSDCGYTLAQRYINTRMQRDVR